jgi:hypothetical protein
MDRVLLYSMCALCSRLVTRVSRLELVTRVSRLELVTRDS